MLNNAENTKEFNIFLIFVFLSFIHLFQIQSMNLPSYLFPISFLFDNEIHAVDRYHIPTVGISVQQTINNSSSSEPSLQRIK